MRLIYSLLLLPAALLAPLSMASAEDTGTVIFDHVEVGKPFDLKPILESQTGFQQRKLIGLHIFIAPEDSKLNLRVHLKINKRDLSQEMAAYRPGSYSEFKSVDFMLSPVRQQEINKVEIRVEAKAALVKVIFTYEGDPVCDFQGRDCISQIQKLSALTEQNLYEEHNLNPKDVLTRSLAATELAQYPSQATMNILFERIEYEGVWVDYELRSAALAAQKEVITKLGIKFGEARVATYFENIYNDLQTIPARDLIIDSLASFESSAALFFVIKIHTYSSSHNGNSGRSILDAIFRKPDFHEYVRTYKDRIMIEILGPQADNSEWAQERACRVFEQSPADRIASPIIQVIEREEDYSLGSVCINALTSSFENYDLVGEIKSLQAKMAAAITEPYSPGKPRTISGFSYTYHMRYTAVLILGEINTAETQSILKNALEISELENTLRELIVTLLNGGRF